MHWPPTRSTTWITLVQSCSGCFWNCNSSSEEYDAHLFYCIFFESISRGYVLLFLHFFFLVCAVFLSSGLLRVSPFITSYLFQAGQQQYQRRTCSGGIFRRSRGHHFGSAPPEFGERTYSLGCCVVTLYTCPRKRHKKKTKNRACARMCGVFFVNVFSDVFSRCIFSRMPCSLCSPQVKSLVLVSSACRAALPQRTFLEAALLLPIAKMLGRWVSPFFAQQLFAVSLYARVHSWCHFLSSSSKSSF